MFVVGTERRKEWKQRSKRPPKPSELGPISEIQFMSTAKRAKLLMQRVGKENDNAGADENPVDERSQTNVRQHSPPEPNQFAVDYARVVALMKAADCFCDQSMIVGHRLLLRRAAKQIDGKFGKQHQVESAAKKDWVRLLWLAKKRSISQSQSQLDNLRKKQKHSHLSDESTTHQIRRRMQPLPTKANKALQTPKKRGNSNSRASLIATRSSGNGQPLPTHEHEPPKKRSRYYKCDKVGCDVTSVKNPGMKFKCVPE